MSSRVRKLALELWLPILLFATWWVASDGSASAFFPPLRTILVTFQKLWLFDKVPTDVIPSLLNLAAGLVLAIIIGVCGGAVLGLVPTVRLALDPIIQFCRALPVVALLPVGLLLFGVGSTTKILVITLGTMWPILLNTMDGVRGVDPVLRDVASGYRLTLADRVLRVILPAASPQIMVGIRTSLSIGVVLILVGEMVASINGIGYFVLRSQRTFAIPEMWSGIILLGIIGYALNVGFRSVEDRVLRWHRGMRLVAKGRETP